MPDSRNQTAEGLAFPEWAAALRHDGSLTGGLRESYRQTVGRFLQFCGQRRAGATVALAREYVELARLERAPSPARVQEWKDALNWCFRRGREATASALQGVPPLARSDLGGRGVGTGADCAVAAQALLVAHGADLSGLAMAVREIPGRAGGERGRRG